MFTGVAGGGVRVSQTPSQANEADNDSDLWSQDHNSGLKLEALKGQCHEMIHFLNKKNRFRFREDIRFVIK